MKKVKIDFEIESNYHDAIKYLIKKVNNSGFELYMVGGSVRDMLLGLKAYDFDFATNAFPSDISKMFKHVIPTGIKHGTVTVLHDKIPFEITTYRCDGKYLDGRRPEKITYSKTLEEDILRRDFTINGLAYDFNKNEVIDYTKGLSDLKKKIIRTIGSPKDRLMEDGLRSFRACRIASKLNFTIHEETFHAISETLDVSEKVSVERIREELMKILSTEKPSIGLEYLRKTGLLKIALPELDQCYGVDQNKYHKHDIYFHCLYSCDAAPNDMPIIRLSALLHDIGKVVTKKPGADGDGTFYNHEIVGARMVKRIMRRLKFSNDEINRTTNLIYNHMFHYTSEWNDGAIRRFLKKVGVENLYDLIRLRMADRKGTGARDGMPVPIVELQERIQKVIEDENAITVKDLDISGHDLMEKFDIKPGPSIGAILNELLEIVLDDPDFNDKEKLLNKAEDIYNEIKG